MLAASSSSFTTPLPSSSPPNKEKDDKEEEEDEEEEEEEEEQEEGGGEGGAGELKTPMPRKRRLKKKSKEIIEEDSTTITPQNALHYIRSTNLNRDERLHIRKMLERGDFEGVEFQKTREKLLEIWRYFRCHRCFTVPKASTTMERHQLICPAISSPTPTHTRKEDVIEIDREEEEEEEEEEEKKKEEQETKKRKKLNAVGSSSSFFSSSSSSSSNRPTFIDCTDSVMIRFVYHNHLVTARSEHPTDIRVSAGLLGSQLIDLLIKHRLLPLDLEGGFFLVNPSKKIDKGVQYNSFGLEPSFALRDNLLLNDDASLHFYWNLTSGKLQTPQKE